MLTAAIVVAALAACLVAVRLVFADEIRAARERDPAATSSLSIILTYAGFHALVVHRVAHLLWRLHLPIVPRLLAAVARLLTGIEIHPGADIGPGLFIDHGMGVVIGETSVIGRDVTLFQGVTLGGTGSRQGKRHPTLGDNVVVGAGAKILGNTSIGANVTVGANAVVVRDVPPDATVVGVPGRISRRGGVRMEEGANLEHTALPDPLQLSLERLQGEIDQLNAQIARYREGTEHSG